MFMRSWRRGSAFRRRLEGQRRVRLLMAIGFACATYSVVIAATLLTEGEADAPWLPSNAGNGDFWLVIAGLFVASCVGGYVHGGSDEPRAQRFPTDQSAVTRRARQFLLGYEWLFAGWRRWTLGLMLSLSLAVTVAGMFVPDVRENALDGMSGDLLFMVAFTFAWMEWALVLKGRELQRGKERNKVADEYLAIREARLNAEVNAMCEKFLEQQQEWKAQKTAELYEQILDQQARGILPCPNCAEHRKAA